VIAGISATVIGAALVASRTAPGRNLDAIARPCLFAASIATARGSAMSIAFVFPGQGSQAVGMGKDLAGAFPEAKAVFAEVDAALGQKLSTLMWEGPADQLTLTENAQPALMAVSMAVMRVLEARGVRLGHKVKLVAGHSLGEYSALAAAGTFTLADTARLLKLRGQAMQRAVPVGVGAMAALLGVGLEAARKIAAAAAQGEVCDIANDNEPTQVVLSGHKSAIDRVGEVGKAHGLRRAMPLPVSAPFHCALMKPAADAMAEALAKVAMKAPAVPVVANVLALPITDPAEIRKRLVEQVCGTVRWRECVQAMAAAGVTELYEIGSGKVLSGLAGRIDKALKAQPVGTPADIAAVAGALA
jgi:[acyl-carrier-protein] S-malonyltransferase